MRSLLTTALAAAALAFAAPGAHAAAPTWGVAINDLFNARGHLRPSGDRHLQAIHDNGITTARTDAFWVWAELGTPKDGRHRYTWGRLDEAAEGMARHGLRWLPVLAYSSYWSSTVAGTDHAPPVSDADFAAYVSAFARRYGRGGDFWAAHPELSRLEITDFEIWNEPNLTAFWLPRPDAARFGALYRAARTALKAVDPQARAIVGGLSPYGAPTTYLRAMDAAHPGMLAHDVDAVGLHPYASSPGSALTVVRSVRRTLDALGATQVPLAVTEVGWPSINTSANADWALPGATRAGAFALLSDALAGSNCRVERALPYTWSAPERDPGEQEDWFGLFHPDATPTEAGAAYTSAVRRTPSSQVVAACDGDGTALHLGLTTATSGRCVTATVTYRSHPVNGVDVDFGGVRLPSDDEGTARRCTVHPATLTAAASVGRAATSVTRTVAVR